MKRISPPAIRAGGIGRMRRMAFIVVVLPQPVSPTSPTFSPRRTTRLTPSSTLSWPPKTLKLTLQVLDFQQRRCVPC